MRTVQNTGAFSRLWKSAVGAARTIHKRSRDIAALRAPNAAPLLPVSKGANAMKARETMQAARITIPAVVKILRSLNEVVIPASDRPYLFAASNGDPHILPTNDGFRRHYRKYQEWAAES